MPADDYDDELDREARDTPEDELDDEIREILNDLPWDPTSEPGPSYPRT